MTNKTKQIKQQKKKRGKKDEYTNQTINLPYLGIYFSRDFLANDIEQQWIPTASR